MNVSAVARHRRGSTGLGFDGRWLVAGAMSVAFSILVFSAPSAGSLRFWTWYGVDRLSPGFVDLRVVTSAADTKREGGDPLRDNPHDPLGRPANYPRLWTLPHHLGLSESHTKTIGTVMILAFALCLLGIVGKLTAPEGLFYSVLVCSPAVLVGVERGNIDLVIFVLVAAAAVILRRPRLHPYGYVLLLSAAFLKLYPVFAMTAALREHRRWALLTLLLCAGAFTSYLILIRHDLPAITSNTQQGIYISYGRKVLFERLRDYGFALDPGAWSAVTLMVVSLGVVAAYRFTSFPLFSPDEFEKSMIGASIYCGTFTLLNSFNYRLIFVLLLVPQLLRWRHRTPRDRLFANSSLVLIAAVFWFSAQLRGPLFIFKEAANWLLFAICALLLVHAVVQCVRDQSPVSRALS